MLTVEKSEEKEGQYKTRGRDQKDTLLNVRTVTGNGLYVLVTLLVVINKLRIVLQWMTIQ